jgi:hypothetical protein
MKISLICFSFILHATAINAQDSVVLSKNFLFNDGLYFSFEAFKSNRPGLRWEETEPVLTVNPQTFLCQIERITLKENQRELNLAELYAVCIEGIPYVRIPDAEIHKDLPAFAPLKLRGKICYFTYPDWRSQEFEIAAYNPLTGRPFRKGTVIREKEQVLEKMLYFETGEMLDFSIENFLKWIQDDPQLVGTVHQLPEEEKQEKLFKCLLIYVDRHPVHILK